MSASQQTAAATGSTASTHPTPPTTWTEPPWSGWIETTGDALLILEAARRGLIPRVTRRLVDSERKMITSGSVFVFDEDESGIKRWTDGFFWSPSRILGNFLLYRETDKRGAGHRGVRSDASGSDGNDHPQYNIDGSKGDGQTLSRPKGDASQMGVDKFRERTLVGSLTNSYKFKSDGLMKKTFSLTIGGVSQHLISYYKVEDVEQGRLRSPSSLPELASLDISPEYLDKTHFRNPPKVEIGVDGLPRYRGEADDIDTSPSLLSAPLSSGLPLLTDGRVSDGKRTKRYDPYSSSSSKRSRKGKSAQQNTSPIEPHSPSFATGQQPLPPPPYPESSLQVIPHPHYSPYPVPGYYGMPGYAIPPLPHAYPPSPYHGTSAAPGTPQHTPPPPPAQHYSYAPPYAGSPSTTDSQQSHPVAHSGQQQPYYSYYPPPPPPSHYASYPNVWPPYGYPPQQALPQAGSAPPPASGSLDDKGGDQNQIVATDGNIPQGGQT